MYIHTYIHIHIYDRFDYLDKEFLYSQGCYSDSGNTLLNTYLTSGFNITPRSCVETCKDRGFSFAGVRIVTVSNPRKPYMFFFPMMCPLIFVIYIFSMSYFNPLLFIHCIFYVQK